MAELAEERQILAYLGILDGKRLTELTARDSGMALPLVSFQLS
jgi:hypothetical protein